MKVWKGEVVEYGICHQKDQLASQLITECNVLQVVDYVGHHNVSRLYRSLVTLPLGKADFRRVNVNEVYM